MIRFLGPLLGCGLMMVVCMAVMSMAGKRDTPPTDASAEEVAELRNEVARLRRLVDDRATAASDDTNG